jgi:hypothetical protein
MNDQQFQQSQTPPPNYLAWAIITTILCCLPFGIVSIIYAAQVNSKWAAGEVTGALQSSKNAKTWAWVSFGAGLLGLVIWIALVAFGILAGIGMELFDL